MHKTSARTLLLHERFYLQTRSDKCVPACVIECKIITSRRPISANRLNCGFKNYSWLSSKMSDIEKGFGRKMGNGILIIEYYYFNDEKNYL